MQTETEEQSHSTVAIKTGKYGDTLALRLLVREIARQPFSLPWRERAGERGDSPSRQSSTVKGEDSLGRYEQGHNLLE